MEKCQHKPEGVEYPQRRHGTLLGCQTDSSQWSILPHTPSSLECGPACLRFGAGGLALCGAEQLARDGAHRVDPVRQASLSKAEASRPHSKFFTNPHTRQYITGRGKPPRRYLPMRLFPYPKSSATGFPSFPPILNGRFEGEFSTRSKGSPSAKAILALKSAAPILFSITLEAVSSVLP